MRVVGRRGHRDSQEAWMRRSFASWGSSGGGGKGGDRAYWSDAKFLGSSICCLLGLGCGLVVVMFVGGYGRG